MKQQLQEKIDKHNALKLKIKEAEKSLKPASSKPKKPKHKGAQTTTPKQTITDPAFSAGRPAQLEEMKKQAEAIKSGNWAIALEGKTPQVQILTLQGIMKVITMSLSNPKLTEEEKAKVNQQLQEIQARIEELSKLNNTNPDGQMPKTDKGALADIEEQKKKMLELINSGRMPHEDMANVKGQYETYIAKYQQELGSPGISEADATLKKAWIQMMQEVNEAIKKKLGG